MTVTACFAPEDFGEDDFGRNGTAVLRQINDDERSCEYTIYGYVTLPLSKLSLIGSSLHLFTGLRICAQAQLA